MAETSCTGSNWVPVTFTGYTCDVYPYKGGYEAAKNIPVATCAMVVEGEDGSDFLLIGHEMLYFGRDMSGDTLRAFIDDFRIPDTLIADLDGEQSRENTEFLNQVRHHNNQLHHTEKGCRNQNHRVEHEIGILKQCWKNRMSQNDTIPTRNG